MERKSFIKPIYFSLYDNFTKEGIIPNGINMSIDEYNKHRYQIASGANVKFSRNHFLGHYVNEVPIHIDSFLSNPDMFIKNGRIIYTIDLSPSADQFPELFEYGMNHFFAHLDERIRSVIREGEVQLILSCLNEKCI